jgi:superfamily I DNA/RNA helicase
MGELLTEPVVLTQEQRVVVDAGLDSRLLVLAGAGTGKTETLVARIRRLVADEELAPGRELLVLSFSRAAVGELRRRIGLGAGRSRRVRPITFDSFATRFLSSLPPDTTPVGWRDRGYDGRIAAATAALSTPAARDALAEYRHVFVDEIQDLVDVRAALVLALLELVPGFTLLGDPAQAIYDHQVKVDSQKLSSDAFLAAVREQYPALQTFVLSENHRTSFEELDDAGHRLRRPEPDLDRVADELDEIRRGLEPLAAFEDLSAALHGTRRPSAVLCRTNVDALRVSQMFFGTGLPHRLQGEATDTVLPAWLARLFAEVERTKWSRTRLEALAAERLVEADPDPETIWRLLSNTVADDDAVDLDRLRRRISLRMADDELVAPRSADIVVSTVHRAKGLEFDLVFTHVKPATSIDDPNRLEELRVVYVAFSRARDEIWIFPDPPREPWKRDPVSEQRWVRSAWGQRWRTTALEITADDLASARPFGAGVVGADASAVQAHLVLHLDLGDPVELELHHVREADEPIPFYVALHKGKTVAETTEAFGLLLARRLGRSNTNRWPIRLVGLRCHGLETVAGDRDEGEAAGLGRAGLWLRPRVLGLADLVWEGDD